jgi:hypothetical protein
MVMLQDSVEGAMDDDKDDKSLIEKSIEVVKSRQTACAIGGGRPGPGYDGAVDG